MRVRAATQNDVVTIVTMLADDDLGRHRERVEDPLPGSYWAAFDAIERDPNNLLVVLDDNGQAIGTLQLTFIPYLTFQGGWRTQIEAVRIAGAHRGRGAGRHLLDWAIDEARRRGCHLVQLTTNRQRHQTRRFTNHSASSPPMTA